MSLEYRNGAYRITSMKCGKLVDNKLEINIDAGKGEYEGMVKDRDYTLIILV